MAKRRPCLADGRDLLLVITVLMMMLGLGLVGADLMSPEPRPEMVPEESYPSAGAIFPGATTSPLMVKEHVSSNLASHRGDILAARRAYVVVAPVEDDPRAYLSKMAALPSRRRLTTTTALDPYQASLNLAVYAGDFTIAATPIAHDSAP